MIYSLPNGKVIYLSLEQYLDLTDEDIQYLMSLNYGEYASSPWHGSATRPPKRAKKEDDPEPHDRDIDYADDEESIPGLRTIIPDEELPLEFPDVSEDPLPGKD